MRILMVHNHYQQYGGEDAVVQAEQDLLLRHHHEVRLFERSNQEIENCSVSRKISALFNMHWSQHSYRDVCDVLREFKPDVCHVYNTFFMITPSVYDACREFKVPVVQSLYNFRMMCANALFLRNRKNCEDCMTRSRLRSIFFSCYRNSPFLTAFVVRMINYHWKQRTWTEKIDGFITSTDFGREKFLRAGIAPEKMTVKPHFIYPDLGQRDQSRGYALYVGRLSVEKGIHVLLRAWRDLPEVPLKIVGGGPLLEEVRRFVAQHAMSHVEVLGYCPQEEYLKQLKEAAFLVVPSISYDNSPRTIMEALGCGVPVLASDVGGVKECIDDEKTGKLFKSGDAGDLARQARWLAENTSRLQVLGGNARKEFEAKYSEQKNYAALMQVYDRAIKAKKP